ncbi:cytochrome P450 714C2-like isoform X2 [Vigna unguiculata]|uniref:cytochrome P450 714C2-like isoform X2 n=1 Tax=Vigna unguiculata TaxID=3917 RepID=UPI0010161FB9|nr:cytochrome P450 714C2-like isoform X2 [Vigna unguiculata]
MQLHFDSQFFMTIVFLSFIGFLCYLYTSFVEKPNKLLSKLMKQGINGPPPTILLGNILELKKAHSAASKPSSSSKIPSSHNCAALLLPLFDKWRNEYGQVFTFSLGTIQILCVNQPDIVRDFTVCTSLDLGKSAYQLKNLEPLLGQGILSSNGTKWVHQRKILAPELYMEKGMMNIVRESAVSVVNSWSNRIEAEGGVADIEIDECMRNFSGNVISKACFGSNYDKSEEIFLKFVALQELLSWKNIFRLIPGMSYLPLKTNREIWRLEKEVKEIILQVVKERKETSLEKDLLQVVLENVKDSKLSKEAIDNFIVDNCKNIYLAGYETTAVSATWCMMLLASNPDWQDRVRAEVTEICRGEIPDFSMLSKMKQLGMVINEALRLYPPVTVMSREALEDMKFGELDAPKGLNIWVMVVSLHTNPDIWGDDAYKFKPERFANGTTGCCKLPHVYMPFGVGPRVCLGQNLAIVELKMIIALILSKFTFSLSPSYVHSPTLRLLIEPEHGVNILVKKL